MTLETAVLIDGREALYQGADPCPEDVVSSRDLNDRKGYTDCMPITSY